MANNNIVISDVVFICSASLPSTLHVSTESHKVAKNGWLNPVTHMLVLHLHIDFITNSNLRSERACARSQECLNTTCFTKRQRGRHLNLYQLFFQLFFLMSRDRNFKCTYAFPCISYIIYFCPFEHKGLTLFENGKFV